MSKRGKLRQKIANNPKDVRFEDLRTLLERHGFVVIRVRGSHHVFAYEDTQYPQTSVTLVIPTHNNRVRKPYVLDALEALDMLFPIEVLEDEEDE